ncbi:lysylphosphatidylglycerol synthase domain-containing protein [Rhodopila sp.]|uniref:lysylphosphatidylglycerol synthase domain-containing protein n=1 Tax=Rhodopila sp. TaxID=2480087 RepID=UPI003D09B115
MRFGAIIGGLLGLGLSAWLLQSYGLARILALLANAGWAGMISVIAIHLPQIVASALAWRGIAEQAPRPTLRTFLVLRWIREGVNNLLPVAQIGGEFVAARLLQRHGMKLAPAIAATVADLTMEMLTQIAFTLLGLVLLLQTVADSGIAGYVITGLTLAATLAAGFLAAQWFGLASVIETALLRLGRALGWAGTANVEGLHDALIACYRSPGRVAQAALWHMISWLLGGVEVCLALHFLGHDVGIVPGLIIESLGQALKAAGFAVPGALGIQEGGYIIIGQLFGLSPEMAIALSLMKRLREVALGVPALLAWPHAERHPIVRAEARLTIDAEARPVVDAEGRPIVPPRSRPVVQPMPSLAP